jgi:4-amino-4-deoxy-L-arabinose transferase-like glycosyltransferase
MVAALVAVVFFGYFFRSTTMSLRGEEPRRGQVAVEMIESGDWLVPREQGEPFLSRPPLQNWAIAVTYLITGERDTFSTRLHSHLATLCMVLIIYGYSRTFLSRTGALAAAVAFATFGEVMQECRSAETEALFTLCVSGSILVWHWGMTRGWPETLSWSLGYALVAIGMLTKSIQAPFYFGVSVGVFLLITRQWRRLFSLAHLAGMAVGVLVLLAWTVPFAQEVGIQAVRNIWMNDMRSRIYEWDGIVLHFLQFPLELFGCLMPWAPLLIGFCRREVRAAAGPQVLFMTVVLVTGVPTCWFPPNGETRYLLPLYPAFAVLVGFVVQRCSETAADSELAKGWRRLLQFYALLMLLAAVAVVGVRWFSDNRIAAVWIESIPVTIVLCAAFLGLAWLSRRAAVNVQMPWRMQAGVLAVAGFMVVVFAGPINDSRARRGNDVRPDIEQLSAELPSDMTLYSVYHISSEIPFYMHRPVTALADASQVPPGAYFCFNASPANKPALPFAWREMRMISMDRNKHEIPEWAVFVGRRAPIELAAAPGADQRR